jgi:uracil-DNA glycosylase family 4
VADVRTIAELSASAAGCTACSLAVGRTQVVFGDGSPGARVLIVGEAPGADEDVQGRPFVGRSGQLLERILAEEAGLRRSDCYITNVNKCRPPGNRDPEPAEVAACRPWLDEQLRSLRPVVVLTLGNFAARALLQTREGITRLRGRAYPFGAATLIPTFHPAAALRGNAEAMAGLRADVVRVREVLDA